MKTLKIWSMMMLVVMALPMMVACGGDDSNEGESMIDGVNVTNGRKLLEMELEYSNSFESNRSGKYKIGYDSKGRMDKVQYVDSKSNRQDVAIIDYDLRTITIKFPNERLNYNVLFSLNNQGYINQISNYTLKYNSNGYLLDIDGDEGFCNFSYENNDLIKAAISPLTAGNMSLFYVTYENEKQGDLYFKFKRVDNGNYRGYLGLKQIVAIIAYQSGLFGKVINSVIKLKDEKEASALFDYETERNFVTGKVKFVCE